MPGKVTNECYKKKKKSYMEKATFLYLDVTTNVINLKQAKQSDTQCDTRAGKWGRRRVDIRGTHGVRTGGGMGVGLMIIT